MAGEYTGVIPDATVLCAKLYSDCNNPEIMFYTVFSCYNRSEVIEGGFPCVCVFFSVLYVDKDSREGMDGIVDEDQRIWNNVRNLINR